MIPLHFAGMLLACVASGAAGYSQIPAMPAAIGAGQALTIKTGGTGKAQVTILGPAQVFRREVNAGQAAVFAAGTLTNAGHYLIVLTSDTAGVQTAALDVLPGRVPVTMSLLARPSRLPVAVPNGISGALYLFDIYGNLILTPTPVTFSLSTAPGQVQTSSLNGAAWTQMNSSGKEGAAQLVARAGEATGTRIIQQVPGDPCSLHVSGRPASGGKVVLATDPVRDCKGNAVPDGTIVTFTESHGSEQTTIDVPLKRGIAQTELPAHPGAHITVASGVVLGNELRL